MKISLCQLAIYTLAILTPWLCYGDIEDDSFGTETLIVPQDLRAFKTTGATDWIGRSKIHKEGFKDHYLHYSLSNVNVDGTFYYDPQHIEGALASLGWTYTRFHWPENPFFSTQAFRTGTMALSFFSARCDAWFWQGRLAMNISTDHWNFNHYANYDMMLWGRYKLYDWPSANFHFGILAQTGMKIDHVYPIFGIDWQMAEKWKLNLIFPINISALYTPAPHWTMGVAGRFFSTRYRADKSQNYVFNSVDYSMATVEYSALGAEALVAYDDSSCINANLHAGYMAGGRMKIANRHNRHGHWFDLDGAPYVGAELAFKF